MVGNAKRKEIDGLDDKYISGWGGMQGITA